MNSILRDRHEKLLHCPPEHFCSIRQRYWPISGRREARKITRKYIECYRFNPTMVEVKMGELPAAQVNGWNPPFAIAGVDYTSPVQIRESRHRGRMHISKGYIAIFVCTVTKAVHLEMVTDLSEAFIATLRRFVTRRGLCSQIFSDNGTNFVGTARKRTARRLGRVTQIQPDSDGKVRVATLQTSNGTYKRPVRKLCLLPVEEDAED